jgi:hypothetical protein
MSSTNKPSLPLVVDVPVVVPPAIAASTVDFSNVTWEDVNEDEDGGVTQVLGVKLVVCSSKQLRTICSRLLIKGVKNVKKADMIDKIAVTTKNRRMYLALKARKNAGPSRKEIQCPFRLMNILFSDSYADAFSTLGNAANRALLDSGTAGNDAHFWIRVQGDFVEPDEDYDHLRFLDDDIIAAQDNIDPGRIVQHDWKKLRSIWKGVNAEYKAALTRFTLSGTNDSNFYNFCNGKLETYYLRLNLAVKPQLNDTVQASLPLDCAVSSDITGSETTTNNSGGRKPKKNELASAIRSLGEKLVRDGLVNQKIECMTKEEVRRQNEEKRRELESVQLGRKRLFDEWQDIQANLRILRADLQNPNLPSNVRDDIRNDDAQLRKRKKEVAIELGMETI